MTWLRLVVDALAVYRLTRLVTEDEISAPLRRLAGGYVARPFTANAKEMQVAARPRVAAFITCPWCISIWVAAGVVALQALAPSPWSYAAAGLAFSAIAGLIADR